MAGKEPQRKDRTLVVRLTAAERAELIKFADERCLNISSYVRRILFDQLRRDQAREPVAGVGN